MRGGDDQPGAAGSVGQPAGAWPRNKMHVPENRAAQIRDLRGYPIEGRDAEPIGSTPRPSFHRHFLTYEGEDAVAFGHDA
jgi:hypothetical protein